MNQLLIKQKRHFYNVLNNIKHHLTCCLGDSKINTCTPKQYNFLSNEVIKFAINQKMIPCEIQGILWTEYRNNKYENNRKYRLEN